MPTLTPIDFDPFADEPEEQAKFTEVDFDPFEGEPVQQAKLTEVDFDPFADEPTEAPKPAAEWGATLKAVPTQVVEGIKLAAGGAMQASGEAERVALGEAAKAGEGGFLGALGAAIKFAPELPALIARQFSPELREGDIAVTAKGKEIATAAKKEMADVTPTDQTFWQQAVSSAATSLGQMAPAAAGAVLLRNWNIVPASFGAAEYGRAYDKAREAGVDPDVAHRHAAISGMLEAGTEYLPAKQLFKEGTAPFKRLVNFMMAEVPGENIAEVGQRVSEWVHGIEGEPTAEELIDIVKLTTASTLIGGGAQVGIATVGHKVAEAVRSKEPKEIADEIQSAVTVDDALAKAQEIIDAPTAESMARAEEVFAGPTKEAILEAETLKAKTDETLKQIKEQEEFAERTAPLTYEEIAKEEPRKVLPEAEATAKREQVLESIKQRELKREDIAAVAEKEIAGRAKESMNIREAKAQKVEQEKQKQQEYDQALKDVAAKEDAPTAMQLAMRKAAAKYEPPKAVETPPIETVVAPAKARPVEKALPQAPVSENVSNFLMETPQQADVAQIEQQINSTIEQGKTPVYGVKRELGDDVFRYETYNLDGKRLASSVTLKPRSTDNQSLIQDDLITVPNAWKAQNYNQASIKKPAKPLASITVKYDYDGPKQAKANSPEVKAHVTELKGRVDKLNQVLTCLKGK